MTHDCRFVAGDVVIFSIYNEEEDNISYRLNDFHKMIDNPLDKENPLYLAGVVGFTGPVGILSTRLSTDNQDEDSDKEPLGHYMSYSYRRGNTSWMVANDEGKNPKTKNRSGRYKVVPRLIMYVKRT